MTAREDILAAIRAANGRARALDDDAAGALRERMGAHRPHVIPARGRGTGEALVRRFVDMAEEASATVARVAEAAAVPRAVADYVRDEGLASRLVAAPDPRLRSLPWAQFPALGLRYDRAEAGDAVALTPALAGIAETGTLLVHSGAATPNTLHFLADTHIAVVDAGDIVGAYEDAWARLRSRLGAPPRSVTLITGPSRSSDIERIVQIGVHGPLRLHIVVVDG